MKDKILNPETVACPNGFEICVLSSNAGFYIGTLTHEGFPNCRISEYFKTDTAAKYALETGQFIPTYCADFCQASRGRCNLRFK